MKILEWAVAITAAAIPLCSRGRSSDSMASPSIITLRVLNEAGVEDRTLKLAEKEAAAVLHQAGVDVEWLACEAGRADVMNPHPCQRERGPVEFWFRIVPYRPRTTTADALGFTDIDEASDNRSAGVCYPAAVEVAKHGPAEVFQILGVAIAHEVGHLILGANAHTDWGVMSPRWGRDHFRLISIRELVFDRKQAELLREELERRRMHASFSKGILLKIPVV